MPLSNREKLEIITRAKKNGYRGDYLELFRMAEQQMRQDMPEPQFRDGGFPGGINVQGFSNVQVPNPVPTDPALGVNVSGFNLSKDFNLGKNFNLNISNPGLVHSRVSYYNKPVDTFGSLKIPFEPKIGLSYNFEGGGFANDINKPKKSTYVDARSGYGFPTTYQDGGTNDPEMMFRDKYNTKLTKDETVEFMKWVESEKARQNRDIMMDMGAYDIQGFWKSGDHLKMDKDNHGSDKWKKPNHPTFSNQSIYHNVDGFKGGTWQDDGGYIPSEHTKKLYDAEYYNWLFGREPHRPEYLVLPEVQKGEKRQGGYKYEHGGPHTEVTDFVTNFEAQNPGRYLPPSSLDSVQAITNVENFLEGIKEYQFPSRSQREKDALGIRGNARVIPYYEAGEGIMSRTYNNIEVVPNWYIETNPQEGYAAIDDNPITAFTKSDIKGVAKNPPKKLAPEIKMMPTIPVKPIPTTPPSGPTKAIPYVTEPTGPSKSDLFFQDLENAQVYYNRPDEVTRGRRQGDATVSTQYIFSPNNPFIPKKGQYFMSEANTRGKRKTYGDLDKAREWEREYGLGTQTDLRGYNVGNTFKHGGFAAFFASDYDKYVQKKENGGEGEPLVLNPDYKEFNPMLSERQRYRNFLMREEAGKEYMKTIDSAIKKPGGGYYKAFENGLYYPYIIEGENEATIGYGRKRANVLKDYAGGITEEQALKFMDEDIDNALRLAKIYVEENEKSPMYGDVGSFGRLDSATQYMLADYPYNVGRLSKFPSFAKAVLTNDPVGAEKEYKRVKDKSTNVPLKRNVGFYKEYVQPFIQGITGYPDFNISNQEELDIKIKPQDM